MLGDFRNVLEIGPISATMRMKKMKMVKSESISPNPASIEWSDEDEAEIVAAGLFGGRGSGVGDGLVGTSVSSTGMSLTGQPQYRHTNWFCLSLIRFL